MDDLRVQRLDKIFKAILNDSTKLSSSNSSLFLEAICAQSEPVSCIHRLAGSKTGLKSLQIAMTADLSCAFINGQATQILIYLQDPELEEVGGEHFLQQIIQTITNPPEFWESFFQCFNEDRLGKAACQCFAWLLLKLVSLPGDAASPYLELVKSSNAIKKIVQSSDSDTRLKGHKIESILNNDDSSVYTFERYAPGGRHDNDFANFRQIAILPTLDELACEETPFLRTAEEQNEIQDEQVYWYLDNVFRLYREDMLYEIREEISDMKKGNHRGLVVDNLEILDSLYRNVDRRSCNWCIELCCREDFPFFKRKKMKIEEERQDYLSQEQNRNLLRHQSLVCLVVDNIITAFPTIYRDESLLAQMPPIITLQLEGKQPVMKTLRVLMAARRIKIIQMDVAVFAYEHVLRALQSMIRLPLASEIVFWKAGDVVDRLLKCPPLVLEALEENSIILDNTQMKSLLCGLTQRVSLIQGPPDTGKSFIGAIIT